MRVAFFLTPVPMLKKLRVVLLVFAMSSVPAFAQDDREIPEEARKQYAEALKEAAALVGNKQYDTAQEKLAALLAKRPREPRARFLKGVVETEQGHADAAMAVFRGLIEDYPELPEPYNNLAVLLAQRGEYESARVALETAIRTAPDWAVPHENLGDIYARLAALEYAQAAKFDKTNKTAPAKLALVRDLLASAAPQKPKT
jgi:tetratricopeptide (TPR) repeat protein